MTPPSCLIYTSCVWVFVSVWVSECMFFLKFYLKVKLETCGLVSGRKVAVFLNKIGRIKAGPAEEKIKYIFSFSSINISPFLHWKWEDVKDRTNNYFYFTHHTVHSVLYQRWCYLSVTTYT